jgi:Zn ribbon nucleic-acid-binding protein
MIDETKYCPNCIEQLKKQKRRLDSISHLYLVCPVCGYHERYVDIELEIINAKNEADKMNVADLENRQLYW